MISLDWKWLFIYPEERVATVNQLVIPVNTPVHFKLTSGSVMNSFFVPQLGSQIYAMAGMTTQLNLLASREGTFNGLSAQFSGDGFSDMRFDVRAVPAEEYRAWLDIDTFERRSARHPAATRGSRSRAAAIPPLTFGQVTSGLFDSVVRSHGAAPANSIRRPPTHRTPCNGSTSDVWKIDLGGHPAE